nr:hypothetical protein [Tanacetum cinerariifolium]
MLKKHCMDYIKLLEHVKNAITPMETQKPLLKDEDGEEVDVHMYRSRIDSLCLQHILTTASWKLMLLSITYYCQLKVNAARHNLLLLGLLYISCIEQFCTTAKARTINGEAQIHAKVDRKKVIISEASIRRDLQFGNEEGVDCLPTAIIFEQLALMSMGRNLDYISGKFLMYPKFIQVFLDKELEGVSNHKRKYVAPSHTKKIFRNRRRVGKGFSGNITPLFPIMVVQNPIGEGSSIPTDPQHIPIILQPSTSQPEKTQKHRKPRRKDTQVPQLSVSIESVVDKAVYKELDNRLVRATTTAPSLEAEQDSGGGPRCQDTMEDTITQTRVESLDDEQSLGKDASKQWKISDINANEGITLVSTHDDAEMFEADKDLHGEEVFVAKQDENAVEKEVDAPQVQKSLQQQQKQQPKPKSYDNNKSIMIEEHVKFKKKDQIILDEEVALKLQAELQAEFNKEQRLAREKAQKEEEANISLIETWNDV